MTIRNIKILFLFLSFNIIVSSCSDEDTVTNIPIPIDKNYLVFGYIFGECTGDCRDLYLLTDNKLYQDSNNPAGQQVTFNRQPRSSQMYEIADTLLNLPASLISNSLEKDVLIQSIADIDYHIRGNIDGKEFTIIYDDIDSTLNVELYRYSKTLRHVLKQIR